MWHEVIVAPGLANADTALQILSSRRDSSTQMTSPNLSEAFAKKQSGISDAELVRTICEFFQSGNRLDTSLELIVQLVTIPEFVADVPLDQKKLASFETATTKNSSPYYFLDETGTRVHTDFFPGADGKWLATSSSDKVFGPDVEVFSNIQRIELIPWRKN